MKTKFRLSMAALITVVTLFAQADDIVEPIKPNDEAVYANCDFFDEDIEDDYKKEQCESYSSIYYPQPLECYPGEPCNTQSPQPTQTEINMPIITFQSTQNVGNCLPGQSCSGYVATVDDYFSPALPGTSADVFLFTKDDVDKIVKLAVEKKLQECRDNPESCGIKTFSTSVSDLKSVKNTIQNREFKIKGYYLQFGSGTYDWIYVTPDGSYAAKLEEGVDEKGNLRWSWLQKPNDQGFSYINIDPVNNSVYFGDALGSSTALPGM